MKKNSKNKSSKSLNKSIPLKSTPDNKKAVNERITKKWFYAILILIPFIFFIILEFSLRLSNYGVDLTQWTDVGSDKLMINSNIGKRYFNNINFLPKTSDDTFDKQKKNGAFRVFVLGGSSAAGFPFMPMGSFSRYIKKRLELTYPNTKIEVINIAMTAVNSYTILDLMPGVLDQDPDLVLIYAGHNEYYGAFGVGSNESIGSSRFVKKLALYLNNFKTTQLLRNLVYGTSSFFSKENNTEVSGTLMSKMAEKKSIILNSETFNEGINQLKNNLDELLSLAKNKNIHVLLGTLISNYKDQKPFISEVTPGFKTANDVYTEAQLELNNSNISKADSLFRLAKDLDALRFRAPEKINAVIEKIGRNYNVEVVEIDSVFDSNSPDRITGNNLMVDHLHPNVEGYILMGNAYYETMQKLNYLPKNEKPVLAFEKQDSLTRANFVFTKLDSIIGNDIVTILKNDWPFVKSKSPLPNSKLLNPRNFLDSISLKYIDKKISYTDAYVEAATICLRKDNIEEYMKYMNEIIYKYPSLKDVNSVVKYFYNQGKISPADYTSKRLGIISNYSKNYDNAIQYLNESLKTSPNDTEILYNLAFAFLKKNDSKTAKDFISRCLKIEPRNQKFLSLNKEID